MHFGRHYSNWGAGAEQAAVEQQSACGAVVSDAVYLASCWLNLRFDGNRCGDYGILHQSNFGLAGHADFIFIERRPDGRFSVAGGIMWPSSTAQPPSMPDLTVWYLLSIVVPEMVFLSCLMAAFSWQR